MQTKKELKDFFKPVYHDQDQCHYHLQNCNESVSSLQCGVIGTQGFDEILIVTYTGRIFGLTTEAVDKTVAADSTIGSYIFSQDTGNKINKLK